MKTKLILKSVISTFALMLAITFNASAFTAVTSGNWSNAATWGGVAPGGSVSGQDIDIPAGIVVNLDMDVTFTGLLNSFNVHGTLTSFTFNTLTVNQGAVSGTGTIDIYMLSFTGPFASMTFTGNLGVARLQNNGATLLLASTVVISDTMHLDAGTILLNSGSNLTMQTNSTIVVDNGTMSIGGGVFNSTNDYNVKYIGTSKTTGIELNSTTIQHLYVNLSNSSQTLTLGSDLIVNADLHQNMGHINFSGQSLTLKGNFTAGSGLMLTSNTSSSLILQGTTPPSSALVFSAGSDLNSLTIDYSGTGAVKLTTGIGMFGDLWLKDGDLNLETGSILDFNGGNTIHVGNGYLILNGGTFTGTATYDVEYYGGSYFMGTEITGSGLTNITVNTAGSSDVIEMSGDLTIPGDLVISNGRFYLSGDKLVLNGGFSQSSWTYLYGGVGSELELNMTSSLGDTLIFATAFPDLDKLTVNIGSGGDVVISGGVVVKDEISLVNGRLVLDNSNLTVSSTGMISGYNDSRYIVTSGNGTLIMNVNASGPYVTFPVGTVTSYSPAYVQQAASGTTGKFMVRSMNGVYTDGIVGFNSATTESLVNRTWIIDEEAGVTVNANIKLGWKASAEVNGFDRTQSYISHYNGGSWDTQTPAAASTGAFSTYEMTRTSLSTLSPFVVADDNAVLATNEIENQPEGITLYPNPSRDYVFIENANYVDDFKYELVDLTGKVLYTIGIANKGDRQVFDVTKLISGYYFIRSTNLDTKQIITKRFIKG